MTIRGDRGVACPRPIHRMRNAPDPLLLPLVLVLVLVIIVFVRLVFVPRGKKTKRRGHSTLRSRGEREA